MIWWVLHDELMLWAMAGRQLTLWWRDDDVRAPSLALDRLIDLSRRYAIPLTLAVVPDHDLRPLAARLGSEPLITTIQHGVDHVNRSADLRAPAEFRRDHPVQNIAARLRDGRQKLVVMPRHRAVFAPPWNKVSPNLIAALREARFDGLSGFGGPAHRNAELAVLDAHVDLLRWNGGARFRGTWRFIRRFLKHARSRRRSGQWDQPVGILTHHLQHDAEAWRFLDTFLEWTHRSRGVRWQSIGEVMTSMVTLSDALLSFDSSVGS